MMHNTAVVLLLSVALLAAAVWVLVRVVRMLERARDYADHLQTCGFLTTPPDDRGQARLMRMARFFAWLLVGKIQVKGLENLDKLPGGAGIITPNHPNYADIVVLPYVLDRKARYMAARGVMQAFGGVGALVAGPSGAFACDLDPGKGGPALTAGVQIVSSGQLLVMWPEGWTYLDGKMRKFKRGAIRISRLVSQQTGKPSYLVPVNLKYGRYPGEWILKLNIKIQYAILILCFPYFRRGVKVVIGEPIAIGDLPVDDVEATNELARRVADLEEVPELLRIIRKLNLHPVGQVQVDETVVNRFRERAQDGATKENS